MWITSLLDNAPELQNGMVPIYKDWWRTAIPLTKYFHDVSVFLSTNKIQDLLHMWHWVNILKDKKGIKFYVDLEALDKRYIINRDNTGQLHQNQKYIPLPKPEIMMSQPKEKIGKQKKEDDSKLEERVAELEKLVIKLQNQINEK